MNEDIFLNDDQLDALQEIANIGMGQAGARLASLLGCFVVLSVPRIRFLRVGSLSAAMSEMLDLSESVTALRQGFRCDIPGEAIAIFRGSSADYLYTALYPEASGGAAGSGSADELLTEVANVLIGACLTGVFEQIGLSPSFSPPRLIGEAVRLDALLQPEAVRWDRALLLEVSMRMEDGQFSAHLLSLMTLDAVQGLAAKLDEFLANL